MDGGSGLLVVMGFSALINRHSRLLRSLILVGGCFAVCVMNFSIAATYIYRPALTGYSAGGVEPGSPGFFSSAAEVCETFNQPAASFSPPSVTRVGGVKNCALEGGGIIWETNAGGYTWCSCNIFTIDLYTGYYDRGVQRYGVGARTYCPTVEPRAVFVSEETPFKYCLYASEPALENKSVSITFASVASKEIRPAGAGGNQIAELIAKVVGGTAARAGVAIQLTTDVVASSGGHDHHDASRPKGVLFPTSGITDANGEVRFKFNATQISGVHNITATCNECVNKTAVEKITVKIPDLVNIFTLPFRDAQWAFPGIGQTGEHSDNHYVTIAAATRMLDISRKYQKIWPTAPKLTLNDASLVWGGKFDIKGTWERNPKAHAEHRIGDNMDIRANSAPGAVPPKIRAAVFRWLNDESLPEDNVPVDLVIDSVSPLWENPGDTNEHFHLRLGK